MDSVATKVSTKYLTRLDSEQMAKVVRQAIRRNLITTEDTTVVFYDLDRLDAQIEQLKDAFPVSTIHAVAMKANPLKRIIEHLGNRSCGLEVASFPEVLMAIEAGIPAEKIVFDSPVKTISELKYALERGVYINVDNFDELDRINDILADNPVKSIIGIRINPQIGLCRYSTTSVAGTYSKFGISIEPFKDALIEAYRKHEWLTGVHLHIGSQGCQLTQLLEGLSKIYEFVVELNEDPLVKQRISHVDIGGGLPVFYREPDPMITLHEYARRIERRHPQLFSPEYQLVTEFGRYLHAHNGWVASRVEYVKDDPKGKTALMHVGADMFLRECYHPDDWYHAFSIVNNIGDLKKEITERYTLAGPLCFAGDMLAKKWPLPKIVPGDYVLIHDAGAYTHSMWSKYNSRPFPLALGYRDGGESFHLLKEREPQASVASFWR